MPIVNSGLGHDITVSPVTATVNTDTFENVIKRREDIRYQTGVASTSSNLAFVTSTPIEAASNLSIADRSTSLAANRLNESDPTTITDVDNFTIATENFVVTDVFTDVINTLTTLPLFFKHEINTTNLPRVSATDLTVAAGTKLVSIDILDIFLQPFPVSEIKINLTNGTIFNNLESKFVSSGDFIPYYVRYLVRNASNQIYTYIDLLDNVNIFRLAEFDDLTPALDIIDDGRKVYLINELLDTFEVILATTGTYAYKSVDTSRLQILAPAGNEVEDTWFIRITNGVFYTNLPDGALYKYHIAEFLSQVFVPEPPIKNAISESASILSNTLIKVDHENIHESTEDELFVSLLINDSSDIGIAAYTTDSSLDGTIADNTKTYVFWNSTDREGIQSIDHKAGFISIDGLELNDVWKVEATYYFTETRYEFTAIDFNPISNPEVLTTRVALFIDPDTTSSNKLQTLFYLKMNEFGLVIESNWSDFDNTAGSHTDGTLIYYETKPSWRTDNTFYKFVDRFSVEGTQNGTFLILGDMTVAEAQDVSEVVKIDTRVRGGGIIEEKISTAETAQADVRWFWDIGDWDGIPYPGNASYLVEVPTSLLDGAGGTLRTDEVRDIIERHTALGVYAVARGYGVEVEITSVALGTGTITLDWTGHGR